jgi:hypothetical protein
MMTEMVSRAVHRIWASSLGGITRTSVRLVGRRRTIKGVHNATRWLQFTQGQLQGLDYQLRGRTPALDASDDVLVARVRSALGPLLRTLDLPRVHVTVSDGVAVLHGDVATDRHADQIVAAVGDVVGIRDVDPHLHIGLTPGDTRPSEGHDHPGPSYQRERLQDAADAAHVRLDQTVAALAVVLARVPAGERGHITGHLRADVSRLVDDVSVPADVMRVRDVDELVGVVAGVASLSERRAQRAVEASLVALAELVPEEVADILAVLPAELEQLWLDVTTADD